MSIVGSIFASLIGLLFSIVVYLSGGGFWNSLLVWLAVGNGLMLVGLLLMNRYGTGDEVFEADILAELDILSGGSGSGHACASRQVVAD